MKTENVISTFENENVTHSKISRLITNVHCKVVKMKKNLRIEMSFFFKYVSTKYVYTNI